MNRGAWWAAVPRVSKSDMTEATIHAYHIRGFPGGIVLKNLPASARDTRDLVSVRGLGRSPGVGYANPLQSILQYSCLENPMDRGA